MALQSTATAEAPLPGIFESADTPATEPPYPSPRAAWSIVVVLMIMACFAFLDRQIIALMASMIKQDLSLSDKQLGLLLGPAFAISYAVAGLPLAHMADRLSRRNIIYFGMTLWSLSATFCGFARGIVPLFIGRVGVGIGEAALLPTAYSMISDMFPKQKLTLAISVLALGVLVGQSAALAISGVILDWAADGITLPLLGKLSAWQAAFIITGLPGLAVAFVIYLRPEPVRRDKQDDTGKWRDMFAFLKRERRFYICHFGGFSCIYLTVAANLGWTPSHLERAFGWGHLQIGLVISSLTLVAGAIALPTMGRIVDHMIKRGINDAHLRFYMLLTPVMAVGAAMAYSTSSPLVCVMSLAVIVMTQCMSGVAASALQIVTPGHFRARVSAIYLFIISFLGMSIGPTVVGLFTDLLFHDEHMLWASLILTHVVFAPLAGVFFWFGMKPMRRLLQ